MPDLLGRQMHSTAAQDAIQTQRPTISEPFQGRSGRWLILYTHPIFSADKRYIGYIAGTLYLHQDNVLDRLLGQHFHRDDSVLRVMDRNGTLTDRDRSMLGKPAAEQALAPAARGETGELRFVDAHGRDMLAGYAPVPSTGWSLIAQRPVAGTLQPLSDLLLATARNTLPAAVVHRVALAAVQADRRRWANLPASPSACRTWIPPTAYAACAPGTSRRPSSSAHC